MVVRGKRSKRAQGRGRSDPPQPSTSLGNDFYKCLVWNNKFS